MDGREPAIDDRTTAGFDLAFEGVTKTFEANGVTALDRVSARFRAGGVHAVVGENGAGKSTLMHVAAGFRAPDAGRLLLGGRDVPLGSTRAAIDRGIFMVYQYPQIVGDFPVWEHLELSSRHRVVSRRVARRQAAELMERYGLNIDVDAQMSRLNPSQIYMLGIAVAAESNPAVLILDEPTVGCTDREIDAIFSLMSSIADRPAVVVLITHKLRDVFRVAETALVMRRGEAVAHLEVANTTTAEVSQLILGDRSPASESSVPSTEPGAYPPVGSRASEGGGDPTSDRRDHDTRGGSDPESAEPDVPSAERGLVVADVGLVRRGRIVLREVSFSLRPGEILGIIGIRENGLDWLEEVVSGMSPPSAGHVWLDGRDVTEATPSELRRYGLAYIPTDRLSRGASLGSSVTENLIVTSRRGMHRYGVLHRGEVSAYAERRKADLDIRGGLGEPLYRLSGGNIQKVILSRELSGNPAVLVFAEPSWGLDIATRSEVFRRLRRLRDEGTAVLLLTTDLDEVLELADRIAVVHDGTLASMPAGADRRTIGDAMLGVNAG